MPRGRCCGCFHDDDEDLVEHDPEPAQSPNIDHLLHTSLVDGLRGQGVPASDARSAADEIIAGAKQLGADLRAARGAGEQDEEQTPALDDPLVQAILEPLVDDPAWIGDDGEPLDYLPEREQLLGALAQRIAAAVRTHLSTAPARGPRQVETR